MGLRSWVVGVAVVAALPACDARPASEEIVRGALQAPANGKVDILFMVDNSASMEVGQAKLVANIPGFVDALKNLPGGLPDVHIAVVSSDMGAGDGLISGCGANGGDRGVFQYAPRGSCTSTTLQSGATFIVNSNGQTNYTAADISGVLSCIAALGSGGCGFEHQLASVARALGADGLGPAPQENQGFLRPDAALAIILLTNEDDCSAPQGSPLFDVASSQSLTSTVGPPSSFRCNEFGHVCGSPPAPPPRTSPNPTDLTTTVTLDGCTSAECDGMLTPIAGFAARIKTLKVDPANQILVATVTGPVTPYTVHWSAAPTNDTGPWPYMTHSCTTASGDFADPAVRLTEWAREFGSNGIGVVDLRFGFRRDDAADGATYRRRRRARVERRRRRRRPWPAVELRDGSRWRNGGSRRCRWRGRQRRERGRIRNRGGKRRRRVGLRLWRERRRRRCRRWRRGRRGRRWRGDVWNRRGKHRRSGRGDGEGRRWVEAGRRRLGLRGRGRHRWSFGRRVARARRPRPTPPSARGLACRRRCSPSWGE